MAIGIDPERIECRKELEKLIRQLDVLILRKNIYGAEAGKSFPSWSEADDIHLNNILNKMKNNKSFRICIPDFIQYIIRADKADMEDVFRKLLDCLPGQGPVYRVNNFAVFMMQDVKKLFLAESSKYLQLLYENEKHRPELEKEFYCWIQGYRCESNAPDVFLAILEGNISVVRFYLMLGGKAGICCSQEDGASGNIQKYYVYIMEEQHGDYCGDLQKAWFCDSMTAAVLSGKIEMICFIGKYVKKLSWNEELKKSMDEELAADIFLTDKQGNQYVRVAIVESDAPTGYMMEKSTYYMYMFFRNEKDKTTEIFNDAYYVKGDGTEAGGDQDVALAENQNGIVWALYPTQENSRGGYELYTGAGLQDSEQQYRLVNWPVDTQAVTVQKYGYDVQGDNLNMNSEELDEYYASAVHTDRKGLKVTMCLERYENGTWTKHAYNGSGPTDGAFTTNEQGYFAFPIGLKMGTYRITETVGAAGYENIYNGSAAASTLEGKDRNAYYFQVTNDTVHITMYNPSQLSLSVKKTDMGETPVSGVTFALTNTANSSKSKSAVTGTDGIATFSNIESGNYKLSETVTGDYSGSYFGKYFGDVYGSNIGIEGSLNDLVNGNGIFLGYKTALEEGENGTSLSVTQVVDLSDYGYTGNEEIRIKNPEKVSFDIYKQDADTEEYVNGAAFKIEYTPFNSTSGDQAIAGSISWTDKGTVTTTGTKEEGEEAKALGKATFTGGEPGIYRITETKAPGGYDLTDTDPKYVAMTGGMNIGTVTVTVDEKEIVLNKDTDTGLIFQDEEQVSLKVTKKINAGEMTVTGNHSFTFTLYDGQKQKLKDETITTQNGKVASVTFEGLSQNTTYYLKETAMPTGFSFTGMYDSADTLMTPEADGYYKIITTGEPEDVSVTAENTYLYGRVTILKVDGADGTGLTGAEFTVKRVEEGEEKEISAAFTAGNTDETKGQYTVTLPLTSAAGNTFRIYEKTAPVNYPKDEENYIEIELKPGEVLGAPVWEAQKHQDPDKTREENNDAMLEDRIFPNYRGAYVELIKYDNVYSQKGSAHPQKGAAFTLYTYDAVNQTAEYAARATTDEEGRIRFTVNGGLVYAIEETGVPAGYKELEGLWTTNGTKADTVSATVGSETRTLYLLEGGNPIIAGETYSYEAFDIPYLSLEIRKEDALNPARQQ